MIGSVLPLDHYPLYIAAFLGAVDILLIVLHTFLHRSISLSKPVVKEFFELRMLIVEHRSKLRKHREALGEGTDHKEEASDKSH